jgi:hypothetical protein
MAIMQVIYQRHLSRPVAAVISVSSKPIMVPEDSPRFVSLAAKNPKHQDVSTEFQPICRS